MAGFREYAKIRGQIPPYAVYQAQARRSCSTRSRDRTGPEARCTSELFKTNVTNGIMGTFRFDKNGDTIPIKSISFSKMVKGDGKYAFVVITKVKG